MAKIPQITLILFIIFSCNKNPNQSNIDDTVLEQVERDSAILKDKFTIKDLITQNVDASNLDVASKKNLDIFNGFKGLKLGLNFDKITLEDNTKLHTDFNSEELNYKAMQYVAKDNIESGNGVIQFIDFEFLENKLESFSVTQMQSWKITDEEFDSVTFSSRLQFNTFIKIFYSAFGNPDILEYNIGIVKPTRLTGNLDENLRLIDNEYRQKINNRNNTSIDLIWENDKISYWLSVSPDMMNDILRDISPKKKINSQGMKARLTVRSISKIDQLSKIRKEIAGIENDKREKKEIEDKIQSKKNAIESL